MVVQSGKQKTAICNESITIEIVFTFIHTYFKINVIVIELLNYNEFWSLIFILSIKRKILR